MMTGSNPVAVRSIAIAAAAIAMLAGAYRSYYAANGTGAAKTALNTAIKRINKLCPDAGAEA